MATFRDFPFALADAALELLPAAEAEADFDAPEPCLLADALWLPCCDALAEVWGEAVEMTPPIDDDRGEFTDAVVRMLTDPEHAKMVSERQKKYVERFSFDKSAEILEGIIERAFKRGG